LSEPQPTVKRFVGSTQAACFLAEVDRKAAAVCPLRRMMLRFMAGASSTVDVRNMGSEYSKTVTVLKHTNPKLWRVLT